MKCFIYALLLLTPGFCFSQIDSAFIIKLKALDSANILKADTVAVPEDAFTNKIRLLRTEQAGLSIEKILQIKIMEERQKDTKRPKEFYDKLMQEISTGKTSKLIENCFVNIYRRTFTEQEIDEILRFRRTSAGKKLEKEFLLLLVESVKGAEQLMELAAKKIESQ